MKIETFHFFAFKLIFITFFAAACYGKDGSFTVMTWNVYIGADIEPMLQSGSIEELAERAADAWHSIKASDFHERAVAIVDKIEKYQPHIIGLQEVALFRVQSPGDRIYGGFEPATEIVYDFEQIILAEIAIRGLDYRTVARIRNADVEVPIANETYDDVRLTDFDITLARSDVVIKDTISRNYETKLSFPFPDGLSMVPVYRGFTISEAVVGGNKALFVNTHLETAAFEWVQLQQAAELLEALDGRTEPIILLGDFNAVPEPSSSPTYRLITDFGYLDTWVDYFGDPEAGYTCCHTPSLDAADSGLNQRIDMVFVRNFPHLASFDIDFRLVGHSRDHRTTSGLWPSDHAGVITQFRLLE